MASAEKPDNSPLILITNDDGIQAAGIEALADAVRDVGEVVVVAPDRNRSGTSHAITLLEPLRCREIRPAWFECGGTPTDCVYLAAHEILKRRPSVVLSGVNAGPNLSFDVHYSGTFGGASEGTLLGIPSIAISLAELDGGSYAHAAMFAREVTVAALDGAIPRNTTLNINVPRGRPSRYQVTFLGHRLFQHSVHRRDDPRGAPYFWIGGEPAPPLDIPGSDCNAILDGIISVTPVSIDLTGWASMNRFLEKFKVGGLERVASVLPETPGDAQPEPYE